MTSATVEPHGRPRGLVVVPAFLVVSSATSGLLAVAQGARSGSTPAS